MTAHADHSAQARRLRDHLAPSDPIEEALVDDIVWATLEQTRLRATQPAEPDAKWQRASAFATSVHRHALADLRRHRADAAKPAPPVAAPKAIHRVDAVDASPLPTASAEPTVTTDPTAPPTRHIPHLPAGRNRAERRRLAALVRAAPPSQRPFTKSLAPAPASV